jgi:hypothetical protein
MLAQLDSQIRYLLGGREAYFDVTKEFILLFDLFLCFEDLEFQFDLPISLEERSFINPQKVFISKDDC